MIKRDIEIQRNIVEKSLMVIKDFIKAHRRLTLSIIISGMIAFIAVIIGIVYYEKRENAEIIQYERILDKYHGSRDINEAEKAALLKNAVNDINKLMDSSYWGFVHRNGYYTIAGMYYSQKMYKEAKEYFLKFAYRQPSSFFAPLAIQKSAVCSEYLQQYDESLKLYQRLERDYLDSPLTEQIYYDLGRMYQQRNDIFKAREYYNKIITGFPKSVFVKKTRDRMFFLGYSDKKEK